MRRRELLDETFDIYQAAGYALTIAPCSEGMRLTLVETARSRFIGLIDYPIPGGVSLDPSQACDRLVGDFPWLKSGFGKVVYLSRGDAFAPVPEAYMDREQAKKLLQSTSMLSDLDEVHTMRLDSQTELLFGVPSADLHPWRRLHPQLAVTHHDGALFEWAAQLESPANLLLVHADDGFVTLTLLQGRKLRGMRAVRAYSAEDVLYYALSQLQALDIAVPTVNYLVLGDGIGELSTESIEVLMGRYLHRGTVATGKHFRYDYSYLLQRLEQQYFPLFAAVQCV